MNDQPEKNSHILKETLSPSELSSDIGIGYYRCSLDGKALEVNDVLTALLEYKNTDELISSGVPTKLNKHMLDKISASDDQSTGKPVTVSVKTKIGKQAWLEISFRIVKDEHDHPVFNEGFVRDITDHMLNITTLKNDNSVLTGVEIQLQEALSRSQEMIQRLMSKIPSPSEEISNAIKWFNKKVLIIDDDSAITDVFGEFFTEKGFLVQSANNGLDALNIFQSFNPDIIISDIMMPGMDGLTLQEKFRDLNHEQKIILVTGDKSKESAKELMSAMGITMLFKPVNIRVDLWNAVQEQFEASSQS